MEYNNTIYIQFKMSEYDIAFFKEEKFQRRKCPKCKRHFWVRDGGKVTCGEPPCDEYTFIGNSPIDKRLNLHEMREKFLSFFEKNDHSRISRYPITARWRDDVFFTQASIYNFQPWVLNQTVKPPANPLAISQPCLRFNDIDNVGKTGRHFTQFEMMAHHAFNTPDNFIYFKDRTVELCDKLLTEELSIDPSRISYIEALWEGGGNSGPCFEVITEGVELATLVFMMYEKTNGKQREMDMQVVDTGYGLERFTWLSQGTSSAYEAVFGDVIIQLKEKSGIEGDNEILSEYSRVAGLMDVESDIELKKLRKKTALRLNIPLKKLQENVVPMENLYTICDHTRALMFMLNDGIVPSNVKAGYFARLLVRRTIRSLNDLNLDIPLLEILNLQINYFKDDFPEFAENREDILDLLDVEEKKYERTIVKGKNIVKRLEIKLKERGKAKIGLEDMIKLYDSHGLVPEIVARSSNLEVEVPDDFYIQVASRHETPEKAKKSEIRVPDTKPTKLGYYEDPNVSKFKARVLEIFDNHLILDQTYFYPEGGGQEADWGIINGLEVVDVQKVGNRVIHKLKGNISEIKKNQIVNCEINSTRRKQLAQHHTATHVINGAARRVLGNHIWQSGAHKSEKSARLDITHHSALSNKELKEIERLANEIVKENKRVKITFMKRNDAERKYGFRLYQGGAVPGKDIRVVNIEEWDVEACGGIQCANTRDIGRIKIIKSERIQDGVVRLEFVAGNATNEYERKIKEIGVKIAPVLIEKAGLDDELKRIASIFSVQIDQLPRTLNRLRNEWVQQKNELGRLEERINEIYKDYKEKYSFSRKYAELPAGDSYESSMRLFDEWKSQKKEIQILKKKQGEIIKSKLEKKFESGFEEKDGVHIVKEIVSYLDVKNMVGIANGLMIFNDRLLIMINIDEKRANIVVASNSKFNAGEITQELSKRLGGSGKGNKSLGIGGGASKNVEEILDKFM